jgi:hypothetical protein
MTGECRRDAHFLWETSAWLLLWRASPTPMCRRSILVGAAVSCSGLRASARGGALGSEFQARRAPDQMNGKAPGTASRQNGWARANRIRFPVRGWQLAAGRTWAFLSVTRQVLPKQTASGRVVSITQDALTLFVVRAVSREPWNGGPTRRIRTGFPVSQLGRPRSWLIWLRETQQCIPEKQPALRS